MQPGFGVTVAGLPYGNGGSSNGALPAINNAISPDLPVSRMRAPSLTTMPRMPLVEKITPKRVYAGKALNVTAARARVRVVGGVRRVWQGGLGYSRALRGRFFQDIGTPLISK